MKLKVDFFGNVNKTDKPLAWLTKNKRKSSQINEVINERGEIVTEYSES